MGHSSALWESLQRNMEWSYFQYGAVVHRRWKQKLSSQLFRKENNTALRGRTYISPALPHFAYAEMELRSRLRSVLGFKCLVKPPEVGSPHGRGVELLGQAGVSHKTGAWRRLGIRWWSSRETHDLIQASKKNWSQCVLYIHTWLLLIAVLWAVCLTTGSTLFHHGTYQSYPH